MTEHVHFISVKLKKRQEELSKSSAEDEALWQEYQRLRDAFRKALNREIRLLKVRMEDLGIE